MTSEVLVAVVAVIATATGGFFAAPWLYRRVNQDLTRAQTRALGVDDIDQTFTMYEKAIARLTELDDYEQRRQCSDMMHSAWDFRAIELAAEHGIVLPPCPPLRPPHRVRVRDLLGESNVD